MHALRRWKEEKRAACLYRILSDQESGTVRQLLFLELADEADRQAELWAREARKIGADVPAGYTPTSSVRLLAWLIQRLGARLLIPVLVHMRLQGLSVYKAGAFVDAQPLRLATTCMNEGLIATTLLVTGLAGASLSGNMILLLGTTGLVVAAILVAAMEWAEVRVLCRHGAAADPLDAETRELVRIYQSRGMSAEQGLTLAKQMIAQMELEPESLVGMARPTTAPIPWEAAAHGLFGFLSGGVVPLFPFALGVARHPLLVAVCLAVPGAFILGALRARLAGRTGLWGGFRNLAWGTLASVVTYLLGIAFT